MMKAVILCAGYGTRLTKDLEKNSSSSSIYDHLIGVPKPLLQVGSKSLICHWLSIFDEIEEITEICVVSNEVHKKRYEEVLGRFYEKRDNLNVSLVSDGSTQNENRTGAVACMKLGAGKFDQDTMFVAGDTLLHDSFNLKEMIEVFHILKSTRNCQCLLVSAPVEDDSDISKLGIIEVNEDGRVVSFLEKPKASETSSRIQGPCVYLMSKDCSVYLEAFLLSTRLEPLSARDAPGNFMKWLINHPIAVYAYHVQARYDIGSLQLYIECNKIFQDKGL